MKREPGDELEVPGHERRGEKRRRRRDREQSEEPGGDPRRRGSARATLACKARQTGRREGDPGYRRDRELKGDVERRERRGNEDDDDSDGERREDILAQPPHHPRHEDRDHDAGANRAHGGAGEHYVAPHGGDGGECGEAPYRNEEEDAGEKAKDHTKEYEDRRRHEPDVKPRYRHEVREPALGEALPHLRRYPAALAYGQRGDYVARGRGELAGDRIRDPPAELFEARGGRTRFGYPLHLPVRAPDRGYPARGEVGAVRERAWVLHLAGGPE